VKSSALRAALLSLGLALFLSACLTSDAPNLAVEDLTAPAGFGGAYLATAFPEHKTDEGPGMMNADVEVLDGRTYRLTFSEGDHKDEPVLIRFLTLNDGTLLAVFSDPDPAKGALYAAALHAANGGWVFRTVDFKPESRDRSLRDALTRHGATGVDFGTGDLVRNEIKGKLTAANLRALFSDPDFTRALEMEHGFRLSPLTSAVSANALE
jgi:hypothetical protein